MANGTASPDVEKPQEKASAENPRGIFPNKVLGELCRGFLSAFFRPFSLEKTQEQKIHI